MQASSLLVFAQNMPNVHHPPCRTRLSLSRNNQTMKLVRLHFTDHNFLTKTILDRLKIFFLWRKRVFNLIFLYETFLCKAEFTRGTRALLPGQRHKIVLGTDTDTTNTQVPSSTRVQGGDFVPGTSTE